MGDKEPKVNKYAPPFSIRLTLSERTRLDKEAGQLAISEYVRTRLFDTPDTRQRVYRRPVQDAEALGQVLAALGNTRMAGNLYQIVRAVHAGELAVTAEQQKGLTAQHRKERADLIYRQETRQQAETRQRVARFAKGVAGLWERATGEYQKKCAINAIEIKSFRERDRKELHLLVRAQLQERQGLEKTVLFYRQEYVQETARIRREIAQYISTATEPKAVLPSSAAAAGGIAVKLPLSVQEITEAKGLEFTRLIEKLPLAIQLAQIETKIGLLSGDMSLLQASLESNLLSDEMRGRIRRLIEKTLETLQLKTVETKTEEQRAQEKTREYQVKQTEFNEYVRQYAVLQMKVEEELRRQEANRSFYAVITNMSYALNGLPAWKVSVMQPPEDRRLDEREYVQKTVLLRNNAQLENRVFNAPENESLVSRRPPIDPKVAVPNLRANVLEVREMLTRAGLGLPPENRTI